MKLQAQKRTITGKKVKYLRTEGIVPANVYGPKRKESGTIQINEKEFLKLFKSVGYSKFVQLEIEGEKMVRVLIKEANVHPLKDHVIDVSFYEIDEDTKLTVEIPIHLEGESPAVKLNLGFLVQQLETIAVHCLPKDLPQAFVLSIDTLEAPGSTISVGDIKLPEGVEFESNVDTTSAIAYIATDQKDVEEEPVPVAEGEEGAVATTEGDAATPAAEGAAKVEEKKG